MLKEYLFADFCIDFGYLPEYKASSPAHLLKAWELYSVIYKKHCDKNGFYAEEKSDLC